MFQAKIVKKIKTHILCSMDSPLPPHPQKKKYCRLWDNAEKYGRTRQDTNDSIIWHMRFACRITKATNTHSECVTFIAFPLQQWLQERASLLRYTYTVRLVTNATGVVSGRKKSVQVRWHWVRDCVE